MKSLNLYNLLLFSFLFFIQISDIPAQIAGGMNETTGTSLGGNNFIAGTVFSPNGNPINIRMRIRLASPTAGEYIITTDDRGQFIFSGLSSGNYTVTIDGNEDFQSSFQQVEILQSRGRQTYNISIRLVENKKPSAKPGVINTANLGIPQKALGFYQKALTLSKDDKYKEAIEQLKLATDEYPAYIDAFNEMGVQYMKLNDLEKAEESLRAALKIKKDAYEPLVNYGIVLFRLKWLKESEIVFRSALLVKKESPVVHFYLGRLLTNLEYFDEAEKELNLALTQSEDKMIEVHRMLANLYIAKGDSKRAIKALEKYLELNPSVADAEQLRKVISQLKNAPKEKN
jgi:tetratricopeptide (TPR) repeat protein